jgi:hypothetical protein
MGKDYHMPQASRSSSAVNSNAARRKLWPHRAIIRDCAAALAVFAILAAAIGWTRLPAQTILASDVLAAGANPAQLVRSEPFLASGTAAVKVALPLSKFNSGPFERPSDRVLTVTIHDQLGGGGGRRPGVARHPSSFTCSRGVCFCSRSRVCVRGMPPYIDRVSMFMRI